ncbi:MAG: SusC/RagA family TonB-linked outer membrane protein [Bacteroidota bacterium]|nr:SusC/RagA family TonB-linked outer membrane protein [Bacteroidota bacterium]MDP4273673.1 SusC/RagA family TonB-linked outer membrane protein [Bacteroidota bacterium]
MKEKNVSLKDLLFTLESKSKVRFLYRDEVIKNQNVTVDIKKANLEDAMDMILRGTGNTYRILGNNLVVILPKEILQQQKISGKITGAATGEVLAGVSISIEGTTIGTISDTNGNFTIEVPNANSVLLISYMGYFSKRVNVEGRSNLDIQLTPDIKKLDEVVVVGYGTQRKRDVTGAVTSVSGETLQQVPIQTNVVDQLQGRIAGLDISSTGNAPGSTGQIRLRGERSFATNSSSANATNGPLFVLDGVPFINGRLNDINPNDILGIEVLKDASATAIYGSRASGGVILINTKRGKNGRTIVNFSTTSGVSKAIGQYDLMDAKQYVAFKQETMNGNSTSPGNTSYPITVAEQEGIDKGTDTYWPGLLLRTGFVTDNQLRVSGGNENTQFSISGGYRDEKGIEYGQNYSRGSLLISLDQTINKVFKVGLTSNNNLAYTENAGDFIQVVASLSPLLSPYNDDGTINVRPAKGTLGELNALNSLTLRNPNIQATTRRIATNNVVYAEANIIDGLKYRLNASLSYNQSQENDYSPVNTMVNTNTSQDQSTASVWNGENYVWSIDNILTYDKIFAKKHHITFTGLFNLEKDHTQGSELNATGIPADYLQSYNLYLANSTNLSNSSFSYAERGLISYMARLFYGFNDKYMLTATVRRDGSSVLGSGHQYFTYPAFAFGWNVDRENFMESVPWMSSLKLRVGYGVTADQNISPYQILGNLGAVAYNFGSSLQNGYLVTSVPNPDLKFEHTDNVNLGVDFGVLNNRITGSVDVYKQKTIDILQVESLPLSNGAATTTVNAGNSKGKGLEITLNSRNIDGKFKWSTDFNISFQRSEITALHDGLQQDIVNGWFVGHPFNVIYDYKKVGIWQTSEATQAAQYGEKPGWIKVEDVNADGKIDASDRQILGSFQPDYIAGLTNRFSYKGFELTAVAFARMGQKVCVNYIADQEGFFNIGRVNQYNLNYWTLTNPTNDFPRPDASRSPLYGSTLQYQDGSFIKMRSISLGYIFPESILRKGLIESLKVSVIVNNPFIIYAPLLQKGFGIDPESNRYGGQSGGASGFSGDALGRALTIGLSLPQVRIWSIGINASF